MASSINKVMLVTLTTFLVTMAVQIEAKNKPHASFQNSFDIRETDARNAVATRDIFVQKLDQIVDALHFSNQKTVESSTIQTSQLVTILREQDARFAALEAKIQDCQANKNEDYTQLFERLLSLEAQLNLTIEENIDLRRTIDILHDDSSTTMYNETSNGNDDNDNSTNSNKRLSRNPRNFLASSATANLLQKRTVAFDAYRNKPFDTEQSMVTYDGTSANVGNAMDIGTGIFTAPYVGTYAFNFHALTRDGTATYVKMMHNGRNVGGAYRRHEGEGDEDHESDGIGLARAEGMLAQSVVLQLEENDQVGVFAYHGNLRDGGWHYTHFTGFLLT